MRFTVAAVLAGFASVVTAHFQMQFPVPRGPFVEDEEPTFCDNYVHAVSNRSEFPLSGGFFTLNSEHPQWTIGVTISTQQDPTSFNDFNSADNQTQFVLPFVQANGEGIFCFPIDLSNTNIIGVENGANVTLQFQFNGGDGNLFQCSDLTLSNNFQIPSDISCSNGTSGSASGTISGSSASGTISGSSASGTSGSSSSPPPTSTNRALPLAAGGITSAVGAVAAFVLVL